MADPTAAREQNNPTVNLSPDEKRLFTQVIQAADKEGLGVVTGDVALSFFPQRTHLPVDVLGEIWQLADVEDKGFLTPNGFYVVLRLIGYAQAGKPVNAEAALRVGPLPKFEGINGAPSGVQPTAPLQAQGSGGPIRVPPLAPDKAGQYASLFEESGAQNGLLPGATAKQIFDRAQLPNDVLVRIWNLADTEMRGMLSCTEFIIAMHLLASFRAGAMRALPQSLPAGLYEAAARRGMPPRPTSGARSGPGSPSVSGVQRQATGGPGRTTSPLASQQPYTAPPIPPQAAHQSHTPAAEGWIITSAEKAKYDDQFAKLDTTSKGFVSGDEAVGFFGRSGLSENDLAQIWDLADVKSEGRLNKEQFAVAMYLIVQKVQTKAPIPTALPANLVPPSMRNAAPAQKSTAPDFQQPQAIAAPKQAQSAAEDLFGLDALSDSAPASTSAAPPVANVQVPQSTGGSSSFATPSSPRTTGSPAPAPKSSGPSSVFKPFQPSSSFGQSMVTPQQTGASNASYSKSAVATNDDLLSGDDEASRSLGNDSVELGNLSNQANTLKNQITDVKAKRGAAEQNHNQLSSQKRELESRLAQLRQSYEQEARDVRSLEERLNNVRNENTKLQQDLALVQHSQQNLSEQHRKIAQQLSVDQEENGRLKEQINQANTEINELKPQIEKAKSDARQQKGLVAINKKQLATVEAERDRLKQDFESATKEQLEASRELAEVQNMTESHGQQGGTSFGDLPAPQSGPRSAVTHNEEARGASDSVTVSSPHPASGVVSPAASVNSMNPFFKRSNTGMSTDRTTIAQPPAGSSAKSPNHSAFDDFFGPSFGPGSTATPPPPASFGAFPAPPNRTETPVGNMASPKDAESTLGSEQRAKVPPSPPKSRQISSSALPFRSETTKAPSDTSSVGVAAPASRYEGSPSVSTPLERKSAGVEPSKLSQGDSLEVPETRGQERPANQQSKELPGAFPEETPLQTPMHTGSSKPVGAMLAAQNTGNDPFSSNTMTPTSARDDFDSAFADFGDGKGKAPARGADERSVGQKGHGAATEFPPIEHYENDDDDDDSDSESEKAFDDNFTPSASQQANQATMQREDALGQPPPANAQASPPGYTASGRSEVAAISNGTTGSPSFPTEYHGLLPAREDPTSPTQPMNSISAAEKSRPDMVTGAVNSTNTDQITKSKAHKTDFDDFDNDFKDLSEARTADDGTTGEDLGTSIASRRETVDEFNPTFDSPAPSTRATTTFTDGHASGLSNSAFADFESSVHSSGTGNGASSGFGTASQGPSNHDWDAMFAGLDNSGNKGSNALEDAFVGGLKPPGASQTKPPLGRAISEGTEHDDPILKNLTGMGFSRDESLKALEKFDYNIGKAADFLTSKS